MELYDVVKLQVCNARRRSALFFDGLYLKCPNMVDRQSAEWIAQQSRRIKA
jgi:hypothetical protein